MGDLRIIQVSDLHISGHRNLLAPMVEAINQEDVDLVIATGDTVHDSKDKESFKIASDTLNAIKHRVIVLPGDYDSGALWQEYFGSGGFNSIDLNGYSLVFLDTSFMGHRFSVGWGDVLFNEDREQYEWLHEQLKIDKYHLIFSHHPFWVTPAKEGDEYLKDTVRAIYSGHIHEPIKFYFKYNEPKSTFAQGFTCVPMRFHGSSCYLGVIVRPNGEMINYPKMVNSKKTAW